MLLWLWSRILNKREYVGNKNYVINSGENLDIRNKWRNVYLKSVRDNLEFTSGFLLNHFPIYWQLDERNFNGRKSKTQLDKIGRMDLPMELLNLTPIPTLKKMHISSIFLWCFHIFFYKIVCSFHPLGLGVDKVDDSTEETISQTIPPCSYTWWDTTTFTLLILLFLLGSTLKHDFLWSSCANFPKQHQRHAKVKFFFFFLIIDKSDPPGIKPVPSSFTLPWRSPSLDNSIKVLPLTFRAGQDHIHCYPSS